MSGSEPTPGPVTAYEPAPELRSGVIGCCAYFGYEHPSPFGGGSKADEQEESKMKVNKVELPGVSIELTGEEARQLKDAITYLSNQAFNRGSLESSDPHHTARSLRDRLAGIV